MYNKILFVLLLASLIGVYVCLESQERDAELQTPYIIKVVQLTHTPTATPPIVLSSTPSPAELQAIRDFKALYEGIITKGVSSGAIFPNWEREVEPTLYAGEPNAALACLKYKQSVISGMDMPDQSRFSLLSQEILTCATAR